MALRHLFAGPLLGSLFGGDWQTPNVGFTVKTVGQFNFIKFLGFSFMDDVCVCY